MNRFFCCLADACTFIFNGNHDSYSGIEVHLTFILQLLLVHTIAWHGTILLPGPNPSLQQMSLGQSPERYNSLRPTQHPQPGHSEFTVSRPTPTPHPPPPTIQTFVQNNLEINSDMESVHIRQASCTKIFFYSQKCCYKYVRGDCLKGCPGIHRQLP